MSLATCQLSPNFDESTETDDRRVLYIVGESSVPNQRVQFELTRYLSDNWVPILERDVDGANSLPLRLDGEVPNLGKFAACRRVARTIYLGSAPTPTGANRGIEDRRVKLGCVMPAEPTPVFGDALRRLAAAATYLYQDGPRYWYSTQPTVTKLAEDRAEQLKRDPDKVVQELDKRLRADLRRMGDFSRVHPMPGSSADVPDDLDARLVVLGIQHTYSKDADNGFLSLPPDPQHILLESSSLPYYPGSFTRRVTAILGTMKSSAVHRGNLVVSALGVVFGDIGTSPLYAFQTALNASADTGPEDSLAVASLIIWSLFAIVTCKYVLLVMRADYKGEGGIFALLALLAGKDPPSRRIRLPFFILLLMFGAALIYGDGVITPAISVLSAVEGLQNFAPQLTAFVLPITLVILLVLFAVQRFGTGPLGALFGGIMLFWFITLGLGGLVQILQTPEVLAALDPRRALGAIVHGGLRTAFLLGAVVLAVTGVEALYADMGHFGRLTISRAWYYIVLPSLILNYLGLAAIAIRHPDATREGSLFFHMVPQGIATLLLVLLAALATIIASQALISGVFSLTAQARDLGLLPRFLVCHTSSAQRGQVYLPVINWHLAAACLLLVIAFRSSGNLAAAYGLAVTATMVITSIAFGLVVVRVWHQPPWVGGCVTSALLSLELPFLLSSLVKFVDGGWVPIAIASALMAVMLTWHKGRALIRAQMLSTPCYTQALEAALSSGRVPRVPGICVIITSNPEPRYAIARCFEWMRRCGCLREKVVLLSLVGTAQSHIAMEERLEVSPLASSLWHVIAYHGYMQDCNAPKILIEASKRMGCAIDCAIENSDTFFVLPREMIVEYVGTEMPIWQRKLFGALSRNMSYAPNYFFIPCTQIVVFTWMLKA